METNEKPKILIIDDDPNFIELYRIRLSKEFDVRVASDGDEGIAILSGFKPAAVLLDLAMPRVSGEEVLEYMQTWPQLRDVPVIVITARHLDARQKRVLNHLANVYRAFEKTVPVKRIENEARQMVLMGRLYRDTPKLIECVEHLAKAKESQKGGVSDN